MAIELAKAYVQIVPSAEGIGGALTEIMNGEASSAGDVAGKTFGNKFGSAVKGLGVAAAGTIGGISAIGAAIASSASNAAEYGDEIDKMSQKMGLSAQAYQEWDAVMQHSGTSMATMQSGMKTLANAVESGNEAFERIGLTQEAIASMNNEDLFAATIAGLQGISNETERTYLAGQLLGRGATELGALLNTSAEETQAMRDRVHELGGVMSDEAIKNAAGFQDALQDMQTAGSSLTRNLATEFLPGISSIMGGVTDIFTGEDGAGKITEGVDSIITGITERLPQFLKMGKKIIMAIGQAIIDNLPEILRAGLDVVITLAKGIGDSLPELIPAIIDVVLEIVDVLTDPDTLSSLIEAAFAIMMGLANGLIKAIPRLVEKIPEIITNLITSITQNAPMLFKGALELILAIGKGLIEAIPELLKSIPQILKALLEGFIEGLGAFLDIGVQVIEKIWEGIKSAATWLRDNVTGFFGGIVDGIKGLLGIHSPSTVFEDIGENMALGVGKGFSSSFAGIKSDINGELNFGTRTVGVLRSDMVAPGSMGMWNVTIDARSVREFNDIVRLAQNERRLGRMYG